jgi:hypothetical protein
MCYSFIQNAGELNCANHPASQKQLTELLKERSDVNAYWDASNKFEHMDVAHRDLYEPLAPILMTCNFTLDARQVSDI